MVRPERRSTADLIAAAAIVVVLAIAATVIWWVSDARHTVSRPAAEPAGSRPSAIALPTAVHELWSTPSPATTRPVLVGGVVVTGEGSTMSGRDPRTGAELWSYRRRGELCGVSWVYKYALAVYPDRRGCGQVSAIDGATGQRGPTRSSYADEQVRLTADGTIVLALGSTRLEMWRSDLVRMLSYGELDAPVKPSARRLDSGCTLLSAAAGPSAVSVLESCRDQPGLQLRLLRPGKDEDEPEQRDVPLPTLAADSGARVVAVTDTTTAVYLPTPAPHVDIIDETGTTVSSTALAAPPTAFAVSKPGDVISWWTGDAVLVFDPADLSYRYTVGARDGTGPLGPAALMANRMLIPVTGGVAVYNPATGEYERTIAVDRPADVTAVYPAVSGALILEQRGPTLVALGE